MVPARQLVILSNVEGAWQKEIGLYSLANLLAHQGAQILIIDKTCHDDLTRRATWGKRTRSRQLSAASTMEEERGRALMIRRQSHTLPLRTSVSMEMIPSDQIFLPLHVYQELWSSPKRYADISLDPRNNMLR